ncbi:hypothetical protein [Azoarcus sp. KH32C]|uniref:hypothetical protein n=1 Tax=Azoarcus sp. KH32C TaxID=748247 RepID=UPI0002385FB9|nr:hypothetical protein [Azoarcus sp. KH32C]BAL23476.1 hypothetical protein AZKH_1147 [Azoarcus sp. KH32C]
MCELHDDATALARTVADEVWDKCEVEIEEAAADSYVFDVGKSTQMSLASMLALNHDEAFERHVLGFFERHEKNLRDAGAAQTHFEGATPISPVCARV